VSTKKPLRESLKQMLQEDSLDGHEIAQLQMQIAPQDTPTPPSHHRAPIHRLLNRATLSAASVLLVCLLAIGSFHQWQTGDNAQQRIAQEVLTNHVKVAKLDFENSSMTDLRKHLDRLDFSPFYSALLDLADLRLLGARYCTLQGVIAVQFKFLTSKGDVVTYYQALYDRERFGDLPDVKKDQIPDVVTSSGFAMKMWKEGGVLTVLAQAGQ